MPPDSRLSSDEERALVDLYVHAWEHGDVDAFVALLKDDAVLSMPPLAQWLAGVEAIGQFFAWATGPSGMGPFRFVATRANGALAFGIYVGPAGAASAPYILHVIEADRNGIRALTSFMRPTLFAAFELPPALPANARP